MSSGLAPVEIKVGKCYLRKVQGRATVRKVLAVGKTVEYETLHGPSLSKSRFGSQNFNNFKKKFFQEVPELADYRHLDGCIRQETFIVLNTQGSPLVRCSFGRAKFYLDRGYAFEVEPGVIRLGNDATEKRLFALHGELDAYFMEKKNDRCVCCGSAIALTRHHVIPHRAKKYVPQPWRSCLCNVLFLCVECHAKYERYLAWHGDPKVCEDPVRFINAWQDHFMTVMKPSYLPQGWKLLKVKNIEAV